MVVLRVGFVMCVVLASAVGCDKDGAPRTADPVVEPAPVAAERPAFTAWTPQRYTAVAQQIEVGCGEPSVPKVGSAELAELVDTRNLDAADLPERPPAERMPGLMDLLDAARAVLWAYARCERAAEFVAVTALYLEGMTRMLPLLDEFLAGFSPDDPTYQTRVDGRARTLNGLLVMVGATIGTLRDPTYDLRGLDDIAPRLGAAFAKIWRWLPPESVAVQQQALRDGAAESADAGRKALIQRVIDATQ